MAAGAEEVRAPCGRGCRPCALPSVCAPTCDITRCWPSALTEQSAQPKLASYGSTGAGKQPSTSVRREWPAWGENGLHHEERKEMMWLLGAVCSIGCGGKHLDQIATHSRLENKRASDVWVIALLFPNKSSTQIFQLQRFITFDWSQVAELLTPEFDRFGRAGQTAP
jgi:hypothetical protein